MKRAVYLCLFVCYGVFSCGGWCDAFATARADEPALALRGQSPDVQRIRLLPPTENNPRNSEGDFIVLRDGRVLFVYTHFTGGGGDHSSAHLAGRFSDDGGQTWTDQDVQILANEAGMNVMSVSLLRLQTGQIALFYLAKDALTDCRPRMRVSDDEARSWSDPVECISTVGYYVMNNDRAVQLKSGRIVLPVALHNTPEQNRFDGAALISCYYSDDRGRTWRESETVQRGDNLTLQEPGVVQLADGRLMMYCRTPHGSQYLAYSGDEGVTWTAFQPSDILSPLSPATIERIPETGDLLLAWNDHSRIDDSLKGKRTPFTVALSRDEGQSWQVVGDLEDNPFGWYCYTAMEFVDGHVLLGHCAGDRRHKNGLAETQITRLPIAWLYRTQAAAE